jgi:hypothetical protein
LASSVVTSSATPDDLKACLRAALSNVARAPEWADARAAEVTDALVAAPGLRIERIVSLGQASRPGFWYDQPEAEWVLLLEGAATSSRSRQAERPQQQWVPAKQVNHVVKVVLLFRLGRTFVPWNVAVARDLGRLFCPYGALARGVGSSKIVDCTNCVCRVGKKHMGVPKLARILDLTIHLLRIPL